MTRTTYTIENLSKSTLVIPGSARVRINPGRPYGPFTPQQFDLRAVSEHPLFRVVKVAPIAAEDPVAEEAPAFVPRPVLVTPPPVPAPLESDLAAEDPPAPKKRGRKKGDLAAEDPPAPKKRGRKKKDPE